MNYEIKILIYKLLDNIISDSELATIQLWLQDPKNFQIFKTYVEADYNLNFLLKHTEQDKTYQRLLGNIANHKNPVKRFLPKWTKYAAAAILVGVLATSYFFKDQLFNRPQDNTPIITNNQIVPGIDKATLTLEDGSEVALIKGESIQTQNATSNGEEIVYQPTVNVQHPTTNILTIPRGGQFMVSLADGTKVWLNSESQLKYPVNFKDGESRQVELVYGEAYFDVSPSSEHKGSDFIVFNNNQEVQVLGTEFNIKAYKDEQHIYTTLVEGKVQITTSKEKEILIPNQQSIVNLSNHSITVANANVFNEVSWKAGIFSFNDKSLKDIMKTLSRWYDMEVEFENTAATDQEFIGVLSKTQGVEGVMSIIKSFGAINNYEINNKTIIIK